MDSFKVELRTRACRSPNLIRAASAAFATGFLIASAPSALAANLLGGAPSAPVPSIAPAGAPGAGVLSLPGAGSLPGTSSVTTPATGALPGLSSTLPVDPGALPAPSLSVPALPSASSALTAPLATLPSIGADLPVGLSPDLKDLSKNVQQQLRPSGNAGQPLRNGFVVPAAEERRFVPNEVVLHMPTLPGRTLDVIARRHHLTLVGSRALAVTGHTLYRWRIDDGRRVGDVIRDLAGEQRVSAAQPNFTFTLQDAAGSEQGDPAQYAIAKMHVPEAHHLANGDHVLVAVIDSGIDGSHPELAGAIAASYDAVTGDDHPDAHGTAMAGAIAAHAKLMGVAPQVRLLAIRAFGPRTAPEGTSFGILAGLDWAIQQGARVVNMSFAGPQDPALGEAIAKARKRGVVFIAAAGNAGPKSPPLYPGADPNVIAVTATDKDDHLFGKANRGSYVAVAAPGVDILTPAPHASMQLSTGTSVAAAHVSGIVALLIERKPSLRPDEVRKLLISTARRLGDTPRDDVYGAGLADALAAVSALGPQTAAKK